MSERLERWIASWTITGILDQEKVGAELAADEITRLRAERAELVEALEATERALTEALKYVPVTMRNVFEQRECVAARALLARIGGK